MADDEPKTGCMCADEAAPSLAMSDRSAILALVDDLAALAVRLYVEGRLLEVAPPEVPADADSD